ncbi:MAG: 2,3-bisphosphoglycerate-independent phosphoglycerate mutase [Candidatus Polarisedimenticolia bacterium]
MVLVVLDGWGHSDRDRGNAIRAARPAFMESLARDWPSALLEASGEAVGLPPGFIGNSEVGHLCLGAGRTVLQDLSRINRAIGSGELQRNGALLGAFDAAARDGRALHLMGLLSDGGVHSHIDHLIALLTLAAARRLPRVLVHPFLDGRDTPPQSALRYLERLETAIRETGAGRIATVCGRYYAMDRDNRWERTGRAYGALAEGRGARFPTARAAVEAAYREGVHDEFVLPAVIEGGEPVRDGDAIVDFNFRADRARQLTRAFTETEFDRFPAGTRPRPAVFVCFTAYDRTWTLPVAFPPQQPANTFGEVVGAAGLRQLRIAETEKYAHVTYFFNGGREAPFPGEERCLVPSPKFATYDLKPEMSAGEVTAEVLRRLAAAPAQVVVLNYANADMVGHTGRFEPTVAACRVIDAAVAAVVRETLRLGGHAVVTADHGNAEEMIDPETGGPVTAHSTNPVPVHVAGPGLRGRRLRDGGLLADVAPTMLGLMGLPQPREMEGRSLLQG